MGRLRVWWFGGFGDGMFLGRLWHSLRSEFRRFGPCVIWLREAVFEGSCVVIRVLVVIFKFSGGGGGDDV